MASTMVADLPLTDWPAMARWLCAFGAAIALPGGRYDRAYGAILANSGYLHVTVAPERVTVDYIRAVLPGDDARAGGPNGSVAFSYTVAPPTPER